MNTILIVTLIATIIFFLIYISTLIIPYFQNIYLKNLKPKIVKNKSTKKNYKVSNLKFDWRYILNKIEDKNATIKINILGIRDSLGKVYYISPNGKYLYFYVEPNIFYPDLDRRAAYGIICIYDIETQSFIDTIEDIGYCRSITSNYDGSIISFGSAFDFDHKNKEALRRKERIRRVFTYKYNSKSFKYEQFVDPIIEEESEDYWKDPWYIFMSKDNQKLIVNYDLGQFDSTIHIYDLIDNQWKLNQIITREEEYVKISNKKNVSLKLDGISDDFSTFLISSWRTDISMVYRFNSETNKYQKIGQNLLIEVLSEGGCIDSTGNRIALPVDEVDKVIIYNYNEDQDKWIETQQINKPEDIKVEEFDNIYFGRSMSFAGEKGEKLLIGTNIGNFINIYNLDSNDNQYKFFERLSDSKYPYYGLKNPKISKDTKIIIIGATAIAIDKGTIYIYEKK